MKGAEVDRHTMYIMITLIGLGAVHWFLVMHIVFEMIAKEPPRSKISVYIFFATLVGFALSLLLALLIWSNLRVFY